VSQPDDPLSPVTAPATAAESVEPAPEAPEAPAAPLVALPVPSGPYRVPDPPASPEVTWPPVTARRAWPVIGPALTVFAVLLWSFVVAGQFTTSWGAGAPLGQGTAVTMVLVLTFIAWIVGLRRSRAASPPRNPFMFVSRAIGIALLAFALFVSTVLTAAVFGGFASRNHDLLIAFSLVVASTVATIIGGRLTSPSPVERTHRARVALVLTWTLGALLTLIAGVDLASNG
jgi:hypothetical protein